MARKPSEKETNLREDMEAALAAAEETATEEPEQPEPEVSGEENATASTAEETSETTSEEVSDLSVAQPEGDARPPTAKTEIQSEIDRKQEPGPKPPIDWSPALREEWKTLSPKVREVIAERERKTAVMMQETAAARHVANKFVQVMEPYRQLLAVHGVQDPFQGIQGLMNVTSQLQFGSPQQKAERLGALCKHYGVDIQLLDQVLAGTLEQQPNPQQTQLEQLLEQRLAPVNELLQRVNGAEQQQQNQLYGQAQQTIEQFGADPRNEFFDVVRADMADFLDLAAQRGVPMSLKDAYERACAIHPEINQVMASRRSNGSMLGDKRRAASSLAPRSASTSRSTDDMSLRETLEAQFGDGGRI